MDIKFKVLRTIVICSILLLLTINYTSAMDWDNKLTYEDKDMKVVLTNALGLGERLGEVTLASHQTPTEVKGLIAGKNRAVMYYDFKNWELYKGGLGEITFTDMRTGLKIEKDYYFAEAIFKDKVVPTYTEVCKKLINKNTSLKYIACSNVINGSRIVNDFKGWKKLDTKDIPDHDVRIGLITDIEKNDYIDGVWTIAGKKVSRHATWQDSWSYGLFSYFNGSSSINSIEQHWNLNDNSSTFYQNEITEGKAGLGGYLNFTSSNRLEVLNTLNTTNPFGFYSPYGELTVCYWAKPTGTPSINWYAVNKAGTWTNIFTATTFLFSGEIWTDLHSTSNIMPDTWQFICGTYNSTSDCIFINGTADVVCEPSQAYTQFAIKATIGGNHDGTNYVGAIDEIAYWNVSKSVDFISNLYDGGVGVSLDSLLVETYNPEINITYPINNSEDTNTTLYIEYIASDDYAIDSCWYSNGTYKVNTTLVGCGNITGLTWSEGIHNVTIWVNDTSNKINSSQVIWTTIIPPELNIVYPINNSNHSVNTIDVNYSVSDASLDSCWWSNNSGKENNSLVCGQNITDPLWYDGIHNITIWANDSLNNFAVDRVTFNIDLTPPTISPAYNLTNLTGFALPINSTWNYSVSDLNLESCWYNTSDDATIFLETCNALIQTQWDAQGYKTIWYYVNDSFGNENSLFKTISINVLTSETSHNPDSIGELGNVDFELYVNLTNIQNSTAYLFINNTIYYPDNTDEYANYTYFNYSLTVPDGWGNTTGLEHDYYWNYSVLGIVENQTTTTDNVTIYAMAIDDCSSYGTVILNLTLNDEEDNDFINASVGSNIEIDLQISRGGVTWPYNHTWAENNASICIPNELLNNTNYTIDFTIGFDATDHVSEFYFLDDGVLSNGNINYFNSLTLKDIILMDLLTADSTSFLFNYFDLDGLVVDNIIVHVFRKYIGEGVFREVERAKQNDDGSTVVHLVEEDVIYYFVISQNGTTLFTSNTYTALCQTTPCEIQLEESGGFQDIDNDWDLVDNGGYTLTSSSSTRKVNLTYALTTPSTMNLTIYKLINDGSYQSIGSEETTSTSGSLIITVPVVSGNTSFFATVYQDGDFKKSQWIDFEEDAGLYFGNTMALFLGALIILTLGLIAVTEGSAVIIFLILGMFISMVLGLVDYRTSTGLNILVYFIIAGGIILWKLTRRTR